MSFRILLKIVIITLSFLMSFGKDYAQATILPLSNYCETIDKGHLEYSKAWGHSHSGNYVLSEKSAKKASSILGKDFTTGKTIKSIFYRFSHSYFLVPTDCEKKEEKDDDNQYHRDDKVLFVFSSRITAGKHGLIEYPFPAAFQTSDNQIEKFELLKEGQFCEATVQLVPYYDEPHPFAYSGIFQHLYFSCKILYLKPLDKNIHNDNSVGDEEDNNDQPKSENDITINALKECMREDSGCNNEYLLGKITSDPFYSNRSGERIQRIWNAAKRKLLIIATANMYNENSEMIDDYISFREKPYYQKALNMLLKLSPKPDETTLEKAGEIARSLKDKSSGSREKYSLSFWYRRNHEKNDVIVYSILKEIKAYYENEKNYTEDEDIHHAIASGNINKVMKLIELGSDINKTHKGGNCSLSDMTPLIVAAQYNRLDIAKMLIKKGVDVNYKDEVEIPALIMSAINKNRTMLNLLLKNGANVDITGNLSAIYSPCYIYKATALHIAVFHNDFNLVNDLIAAGANVNAVTENIETPINLARDEKMFNLLEEKGSKIFNDSLPLHKATMYGNQKILKILISRGVSVNSRNSTGETPLHCAAVLNNIDNAKVLIENGCDVNAKTRYNKITSGSDDKKKEYIIGGGTPLHYLACYNHNDEFAKLLIKSGAAIKEKDYTGRTPYDIFNIGERPTNNYPYEWESSYRFIEDIIDYSEIESEIEKKQERFWKIIKTD